MTEENRGKWLHIQNFLIFLKACHWSHAKYFANAANEFPNDFQELIVNIDGENIFNKLAENCSEVSRNLREVIFRIERLLEENEIDENINT